MSVVTLPDSLQGQAGGQAAACPPHVAAPSAWQALSLRANFSWTLAGTVVYAACQWAVLAALARLASPEVLGEFAFATAVAMPIMTFSMLHLRALQATDARGDFLLGEFVALRLGTTALALAAVAACAVVGTESATTRWLILAAGAVAAADALSDVFHGALQQRERLDRVALTLLIKGPASLAAVAAALILGGGALEAAVAMAAVRWGLLAVYETPLAVRSLSEGWRGLRPCWNWPRLVRLAVIALPLGIAMLLMSLRTNVPRYLLCYHVGEGELGVFVSLVALTQLSALVVNAWGQAASPRLAQYHHAGRHRDFLTLTVKLVLLGGVLGGLGIVVVAIAGPEILSRIYGTPYADSGHAFLILMLAAAVGCASGPLGYAATAARQIRVQPVLHTINLAVTAGAAWWAAPSGAEGMAWAVLASAVCSAFLFAALLAVSLCGSGDATPRKNGVL